MGFLEKVAAEKRAEVEARRKLVPEAELSPHPKRASVGFAESLREPGIRLICEVKRRSPTEPNLAPEDPVEVRVQAYASQGAAAISVLTDTPHFGGSLEDLARFRGQVATPLLRKDFLLDRYQLLEARHFGADAVLLIVAMLERALYLDLLQEAKELGLDVLVEVHDRAELEVALDSGAKILGINNRNLKTLEISLDTCRELLPEIPKDRIAVAESGIYHPEEVQELSALGAKAFLVGTALMKAPDPAQAVAYLKGESRA